MTNEYILALQAKLSLTPSPRPYLIPSLSRVTSRDCGISYLIPNVATGSAQITCIDPQSTISAELIKSGYKKAEAVPIYLHVYIKADEDITRLFLESVVTE